MPLLITKIIIALIGGYTVDFAFRKSNKETLVHIKAYAESSDNEYHNRETIIEKKACCGHSTSPSSVEFDHKEIILHPITHTAKVFITTGAQRVTVRQESSFRHLLLMHEMCYATEKMRIGPSKSLYRKWFQTTHRLLWSKATVVSVMGKGEAVTSSGVC